MGLVLVVEVLLDAVLMILGLVVKTPNTRRETTVGDLARRRMVVMVMVSKRVAVGMEENLYLGDCGVGLWWRFVLVASGDFVWRWRSCCWVCGVVIQCVAG